MKRLQLADHAGILLLIAGTYSPTMAYLCYFRVLTFVWIVGSFSFFVKAIESKKLDRIEVHLCCFMAMGWVALPFLPVAYQNVSVQGLVTCITGGLTYTIGLIPWSRNKMEFHNAIWHVFVLVASAQFYYVVYTEVLVIESWIPGAHTCSPGFELGE